eukprot:EG_transcript_14731
MFMTNRTLGDNEPPLGTWTTLDFRSPTLQFNHSFMRCASTSPLPYHARKLTLLVLDVGISSSLITSLLSWNRYGLLEYVRSVNLFINRMLPEHCHLVEQTGIRVFGSPNNVGIPAALDFLFRFAETEFALFLEKDWQLTGHFHLVRAAHELLVRNSSVDLVLLGNTTGSMNQVWCSNSSILRTGILELVPFYSTIDPKKAMQSCMKTFGQSMFRHQFRNARLAVKQCPEGIIRRLVEPCLPVVLDVSSGDHLWCAAPHMVPWTNNPFMTSRSWVLRHVLPFVQRCKRGQSKCLYMGVEGSISLQCHVRVYGGLRGLAHPSPFEHHDLDYNLRDRGQRKDAQLFRPSMLAIQRTIVKAHEASLN